MPIATENTHESREYFTLGVAQLPGGTAADYVDHIYQGLQQTADTYAGWTGQDSTEVLNKIKRYIILTQFPIAQLSTIEWPSSWKTL